MRNRAGRGRALGAGRGHAGRAQRAGRLVVERLAAGRGGRRRAFEVEGLPASAQPLDIFLLCRAPTLSGEPAWVVWRDMTAHGTLSGLLTPSAVYPSEISHRLPQHLMRRRRAADRRFGFPLSRCFCPAISRCIIRCRDACRWCASEARSRRARWESGRRFRSITSAPIPSPSRSGSGSRARRRRRREPSGGEAPPAAGRCATRRCKPNTAEARLSAPATAAMDLYLATKVVGFNDVDWCHAVWRELAAVEPVRA